MHAKEAHDWYLVHKEIFSEKCILLWGRLFALVGQQMFEGCSRIVQLLQVDGLSSDGKVYVVLVATENMAELT